MSGLGNKKIMSNNIKRYMQTMGRDRNDVCKAIGVPYTTFTDWINANTYPRIDKIEAMAQYFEIKKSDLVEEFQFDFPAQSTSETPEETDLRTKYRALDRHGKHLITSLLEMEYGRMLKEQEDEKGIQTLSNFPYTRDA